MDTWELLRKELSYYGIRLVSNKKCQIVSEDGEIVQGIIKSLKQVNNSIKKQKSVLSSIWDEIHSLLHKECPDNIPIDEKMERLFIFSLKDLSKFLLCFEEMDESNFQTCIEESLNRDIRAFNKNQIYKLPDYKIMVDWVHRTISRLIYVSKLLSFAALGKRKVSEYDFKVASGRGVTGPFANLDLPMEERMFPFGQEAESRVRAKRRQRRYEKGLESYNNDGRVAEGHYWREPRNEPFKWSDRAHDDPYSRRALLN